MHERPEKSETSNKVCRICRDSESAPLFAPCLCNSYVHQDCLLSWFKAKRGGNDNDIINFDSKCEVCHEKITFKRGYNTEEQVSFLSILKTYVGTLSSLRKYIIGALVFLQVFCFFTLWFVLKKLFFFNMYPEWTSDYFLQNSEILETDMRILIQHLLFLVYIGKTVLGIKLGRRILNRHLGKALDESIFRYSLRVKHLLVLVCCTPILVVLGIIMCHLPGALMNALFDTNSFTRESIHTVGTMAICSIISLIPYTVVPVSYPTLSTLIFYTKYGAKLATVQYLQIISPIVVLKPTIDYMFANNLLGTGYCPMTLQDTNLFRLFFNPYMGLLQSILYLMQIMNKELFRPGAFYFFPRFDSRADSDDSIFLLSSFSITLDIMKDICRILAVFFLNFGCGLMLLTRCRPDVLPLKLGLLAVNMDLDDKNKMGVSANIDKLVLLSSPLTVKFAKWFYVPIAKKIASNLKLSSFLFAKSITDQRGHIIYRNWKYKWGFPREAEFSNENLFTNPVSVKLANMFFLTEGSVHAYFVPDGHYARVPNYSGSDGIQKYFDPVTSDDKLLQTAEVKETHIYNDLKEPIESGYDVVHLPPSLHLRLYVFHLLMSVFNTFMCVYFLVSSDYIGKSIFRAMWYTNLKSYIDYEAYFSFLNIMIGLFLQLLLINTLKDKFIFWNTTKAIGKFMNLPLLYYISCQLLFLACMVFAHFTSYILVTGHILFKLSIYQRHDIPILKELDCASTYLGIYPCCIFKHYLSVSLIPVTVYLSFWSFYAIQKLTLLNSNRARAQVCFQQICIFTKVCLKYFVFPLLIQTILVFLRNFKNITNLEDMSKYVMQAFMSSKSTSWFEYAFVAVGPVHVLLLLLNKIFTTLRTDWNLNKLSVLDKLHSDSITLEDFDGH